MNGAAFPSPAAEMAEINRIHYELEYTEGISQRMRIPEKLKVAPHAGDQQDVVPTQAPHSVLMQVPERIVVAGDTDASQYTRPRDLDLIQSTPMEAVALKTPPRVLTLNDQPLDFLETERSAAPAVPVEDVNAAARSQSRLRRERSSSDNTAVRHNGQLARTESSVSPAHACACPAPDTGLSLYSTRGILSLIQSTTRRAYQQVLEVLDENHHSKPSLRGGSASSHPQQDSRYSLCTLDNTLEGNPDDVALADAAMLRRQIVKLNRRLQLLEEESRERAKREMIMYSITVAFWLLNSWIWLRR